MTPANRARLLATYAPARSGLPYGVRHPRYTLKGYHRGWDWRRQNQAQTASVETDVAAIDDGKVVFVGAPVKDPRHPRALVGPIVVIDTGRKKGRYESHSHTIASVKFGDIVESGSRLGRNARMNEHPGLIDGVHDHITITDTIDGAWMKRTDYNPMPYIAAAIARAQATPEEEEVPDITKRDFAQSKRQVIADGPKAYLRLNDEGHVTVARGPLIIGGGVLRISGVAASNRGPMDTGGFIPVLQVEAVIDRLDDQGKVVGTTTLGIQEVPITAGATLGMVPLPPVTLSAEQSLRYKASIHGMDAFTLSTTSLRFTSYPVGK